MINALRGMKDIIFEDAEKYIYFIENSQKIVKKYGFNFIQTPLLEETSLFIRSVGESSDIVGKEMYRFIDKGKNDVSLRPEGTAGVVRSFIQNKLDKRGGRYRFYYYGNMFRYERPQKGRLRQFTQFGVESFGEKSYLEDVTMILLLKEILDFFKIETAIKLNSLGCQKCLPPFKKELIKFLEGVEDKICEDCKRRKITNPIRVFDCKNEKCQEIYKKAPRLNNSLCDECSSDFENLKKILDELNIKYELDENLVRGLDYYNKTAFEFVSNQIGSQNAVAGGGRYDKLVEYLDGKPTYAVGFAIGFERIIDMIELPKAKREGYYFGAMDSEAITHIFKIASKYRKNGRVEISYQKKSLKAHLKSADKINARYCVVVGENELKNQTLWIKDLELKEEKIEKLEE